MGDGTGHWVTPHQLSQHQGAGGRLEIPGHVHELGGNLVVLQVPLELSGSGLAGDVVLTDKDQSEISELLRSRRRQAGVEGTPAVAFEYTIGTLHAVEDGRHRVAPLAHLRRRRGGLGRYPNRRMGLLVGAGPDVDLPMLEVITFPAERTVMS